MPKRPASAADSTAGQPQSKVKAAKASEGGIQADEAVSEYQFKYVRNLPAPGEERHTDGKTTNNTYLQTAATMKCLEDICRQLAGQEVIAAVDDEIKKLREGLLAGEAAYVAQHFSRHGEADGDPLKLLSADSCELSHPSSRHVYFNQFNTLFVVPSPGPAPGAVRILGRNKNRNDAVIAREMGEKFTNNKSAYIRIPALARAVYAIVERYGDLQRVISRQDAYGASPTPTSFCPSTSTTFCCPPIHLP